MFIFWKWNDTAHVSLKLVFLTEQYIVNNPSDQYTHTEFSLNQKLPFFSCRDSQPLTAIPPGHYPGIRNCLTQGHVPFQGLPAANNQLVWKHKGQLLSQLGMTLVASRGAQLVKNQPAMWETWVQLLGWEDPLEKGKATYSNILAWRIPWTV